ncbi:hypothetical protein [Novosphingobium sp. 9U]|uniref:hypothetical protein n=1 Tax=Novosphingobium sp. 9U TaxID=2653158 RepID=UPI0012F3082E|nr:hypothetical protein [Novosphingobium sp. 9U]VWX54127.1 hypothetical protein NOVOSPHI9U_60042 [Novosphingobium sp. 9U]
MKGPAPVAPGEAYGFGTGGFVVTSDVDGFGRAEGTYGWDGAAGTQLGSTSNAASARR